MKKENDKKETLYKVTYRLLECCLDPKERKFVHNVRYAMNKGKRLRWSTWSQLGSLSVKYLQDGEFKFHNWWPRGGEFA